MGATYPPIHHPRPSARPDILLWAIVPLIVLAWLVVMFGAARGTVGGADGVPDRVERIEP